MANFIQFLIGVSLVLAFITLINANSLPDDVPTVKNISIAETVTEVKEIQCYTDGDCNGHGSCVNSSCACSRGWTTHHNATEKKYCSYPQRSKRTAFLVSLFAGYFGADWFYLSRENFGYIIAGILKLLLVCGCCGSWPLTYFRSEVQNSDSFKVKIRGISTCFSLLAFAWWIVDWARVLGNRFPDGNGIGLIPW